jgi:hypothetical protein
MMLAAPVSYSIDGNSFHAEKSRLWTEPRLANVGQYDLSQDGKRIVPLLPVGSDEQQIPHPLFTFLQNFPAKLKRLTARESEFS